VTYRVLVDWGLPGPGLLVGLLPRVFLVGESCLSLLNGPKSLQLRTQGIRLSSDGQLLQVTIAFVFFLPRHSSYGRLLDDHDYGSWGNYNNPLYDDS
jgi:hypothetical protein